MFSVIFLVLFFKTCACVIYSINETDYNKMPPLYAMDNYDTCLLDPDGTYCVVDFGLFSRRRSALMQFIQEYSEYKKKHYNHTQIHRGVCVTQTCKNYLPHSINGTVDLEEVLGACHNKTIWDKYKIEAKLEKLFYCKKKGDRLEIDNSDIGVLAVYAVIILLHIVGNSYEIIKGRNKNKAENQILLAFSLKRNWSRLIAPSGTGPEPRLQKLKMINGMRSLTMLLVIFSHTVLVMVHTYIENPLAIEKTYDDPSKQIVFNGTLVTYTFLTMSSFLLVYNFLIHSEKHPVTWWDFPKGVVLRWIRLTPTYGLIIATIATWIRHFGDGPLWNLEVVSESDACRSKWWINIAYINNYLYAGTTCIPQAWYLAADTQLFCFALLVLVVARTPRARKIVVSLLFVLSLIIPAVVTYVNNLDGPLLQTPENYRSLYSNDETFKKSYIAGHSNLSVCLMGMIAAMIAYSWQNEKRDFSEYKSYRCIFWLVFPAGVAIILSGSIFYIDGLEWSLGFRAVYASLYRVAFIAMVCVFMVGCMFEFENLYRPIVEWRGFTWISRVSYSAFLLHTIVQRSLIGIQKTPMYFTDYFSSLFLHASLYTSYTLGVALYLLVEAPAAALVKAILAPSTRKPQQQIEDK